MITGMNKKRRAFGEAAGFLFLLLVLAFWGSSPVVIAQDDSATATAVDPTTTSSNAEVAPVIDLWYGSDQVFGEIGTPQEWVNILGNVSDPDGISSLMYSLNEGPEQAISFGPDGKRLAYPGDFNVDLRRMELHNGANQVVITATDMQGAQATQTVNLTYESSNLWPFPYTVEWEQSSSIQDSVQIVDGKWTVGPDGLHPAEVGYDRLVAIGDLVWRDYEIIVPITIHSVHKQNDSGSPPALGIFIRWTGHIEDASNPGQQPKAGWDRDATIAWWRWEKTTKLEFEHGDQMPFEPVTDVPYIFKVRVESTPEQGAIYRLKVWEASQSEPSAWMLTKKAKASAPQNGSFLLLAHHVDSSFGDLQVNGLAPLETPTPTPSNTPTATPTMTATRTPLATETPLSTPTATQVSSLTAADDADTIVNISSSAANTEPEAESGLSNGLLYVLAFGLMIVILVGLVLIRRRAAS